MHITSLEVPKYTAMFPLYTTLLTGIIPVTSLYGHFYQFYTNVMWITSSCWLHMCCRNERLSSLSTKLFKLHVILCATLAFTFVCLFVCFFFVFVLFWYFLSIFIVKKNRYRFCAATIFKMSKGKCWELSSALKYNVSTNVYIRCFQCTLFCVRWFSMWVLRFPYFI